MNNPLDRQREVLRRIAARLTAVRKPCRVPSLILLTDDSRDADWTEAVAALPASSAVIVRARDAKRREELARALLKLARPRRISVFVAADPELAIRLRADGVHWPEKLSARACGMKRAFPNLAMTLSAHGSQGLRRAHELRADAALLSPVFPTYSHASQTALGPVRWGLMRGSSRVPVLALGGIESKTASRLFGLKPDGVAMIGGWVAPV
jgi:thiamine-phosphate pyrophosphorylase